jgi:hypothetical protein
MSSQITDPVQASELNHDHEYVWPEWVYPYPAGVSGGLLGGAAIALVGLTYGLISGTGPWLPINLVAATVLRDLQAQSLATLQQFNLLALVVGLMIHVIMSISLGEMFSFILPALPGRPLYWGPVIGPLLWIGASVAALPILNPVMALNVEPISFTLANLLYGLVLGWWIDRTPMIHVKY